MGQPGLLILLDLIFLLILLALRHIQVLSRRLAAHAGEVKGEVRTPLPVEHVRGLRQLLLG